MDLEVELESLAPEIGPAQVVLQTTFPIRLSASSAQSQDQKD